MGKFFSEVVLRNPDACMKNYALPCEAVLVEAVRIEDELVCDEIGHLNARTGLDALGCLGDAQLLAREAVVLARPATAGQALRVAAVVRTRAVAAAFASAVAYQLGHYSLTESISCFFFNLTMRTKILSVFVMHLLLRF